MGAQCNGSDIAGWPEALAALVNAGPLFMVSVKLRSTFHGIAFAATGMVGVVGVSKRSYESQNFRNLR